MLTIVSATNLVDASYLRIGSDPYCIIFLRSQRSGGLEKEIYRTNICEQTSTPVFSGTYCSFQVPRDVGWFGFDIRIEVRDSGGGEFLGGLLLKVKLASLCS